MTWYAVHDAAGALLSIGTSLGDPLPDGLTALELAEQPDLALVEWDVPTLSFVARPPAVKVLMPIAFLKLFTLPEDAAIREAAVSDAMIRAFLARVQSSFDGIHMNDPDVLAGIAYVESKGYVTAERAAVIRNG